MASNFIARDTTKDNRTWFVQACFCVLWNFVARHNVECDHSSISLTVLLWFRASEGYERQLASPNNRFDVHGLRLMSAGHRRGGLLLQLPHQVLRAAAKFLSSTRVQMMIFVAA